MDGVIYIGRGDQGYPALLGRIPDPPDCLYCRGNTELLDSFCTAVVGTRLASEYGRRAAADIARELAGGGVTVVSGLAIGIDAVAHRATLDANGKTIAVLGNGVGDAHIGPPSNIPLAHDILAGGGLLVSECAGDQPYHPGTFPKRNRIISGLSHGTVVVEADMKSGSIITAKAALEQGREVFAVPGSIYWPRSVGSNWLIGQGARPATSAADVLECYRFRQLPLPEAVSTSDPVQDGILAMLHAGGPAQLDSIVAAVGGDASRAMAALALLELHGAVHHRGGGTYSIE